MYLLRGFVVWVVLILAESVNGTIRESALVPALGEPIANRMGFATGVAVIFGVAWLFARWIGANGDHQWLAVGTVWVGLTLPAEVLLGRFVREYPWARIAAEYDLLQGGLMSLGMAYLLVAPWLAAKVRGIQ